MSSLPPAPVASKPAGAYRPPGARGSSTPTIFLREDQGGFARTSSSSSMSNGLPVQNGGFHRNAGNQRRAIPGAPPPSDPKSANNNRKGGKKTGGGKKEDGQPALAALGPVVQTPVEQQGELEADPLAKRIRNLSKKVCVSFCFVGRDDEKLMGCCCFSTVCSVEGD